MLRPAMVFSDHMVLQQKKEISVFGQADGEVTVSLGHYRGKTQSRQGKFLVLLPPMEAGGPYVMTVRCGNEEIIFQNVMIGEVFICGGQSNMEFRLRDDRDFEQADQISVPSIRFFETPPAATAEEAERMEAGRAWKPLEACRCGDISAVSFYAALEMEKKTIGTTTQNIMLINTVPSGSRQVAPGHTAPVIAPAAIPRTIVRRNQLSLKKLRFVFMLPPIFHRTAINEQFH